jgi:hypothetical protein
LTTIIISSLLWTSKSRGNATDLTMMPTVKIVLDLRVFRTSVPTVHIGGKGCLRLLTVDITSGRKHRKHGVNDSRAKTSTRPPDLLCTSFGTILLYYSISLHCIALVCILLGFTLAWSSMEIYSAYKKEALFTTLPYFIPTILLMSCSSVFAQLYNGSRIRTTCAPGR